MSKPLATLTTHWSSNLRPPGAGTSPLPTKIQQLKIQINCHFQTLILMRVTSYILSVPLRISPRLRRARTHVISLERALCEFSKRLNMCDRRQTVQLMDCSHWYTPHPPPPVASTHSFPLKHWIGDLKCVLQVLLKESPSVKRCCRPDGRMSFVIGCGEMQRRVSVVLRPSIEQRRVSGRERSSDQQTNDRPVRVS